MPSLPSGIRAAYRAELRWTGYRRLRLSSHPARGHLCRPCRGRYSLLSQELLLEDFCGLFLQHRPGASGESILIYPEAAGALRPSLSEQTRIPEREVLYTSLKNQDFFESRPYFPGDDPRRINWKMMARHGELFIREGSGCLPSRSRILLILDPGEDVLGFGYLRGSVSQGDLLLRHAASLIRGLRRDGCRIDLAGPERRCREGLETLPERAVEEILALIPPRKLKDGDLSEILKPADVVCFISAGKPDKGILERFADAEQKILILPRAKDAAGNASHRINARRKDAFGKGRRAAGVKLNRTLEGWNIAYP